MKRQISTRLGVAHIRDTMEQFVDGLIDAQSAMEDLGIGKTRLYELRTAYLNAKSGGVLGD